LATGKLLYGTTSKGSDGSILSRPSEYELYINEDGEFRTVRHFPVGWNNKKENWEVQYNFFDINHKGCTTETHFTDPRLSWVKIDNLGHYWGLHFVRWEDRDENED
jgi:hypothetical protein